MVVNVLYFTTINFFTKNVYSCLNLPCFFLKTARQNTITVTDSKSGGPGKARAPPWTSWFHLKNRVQRTKPDLPLTWESQNPCEPQMSQNWGGQKVHWGFSICYRKTQMNFLAKPIKKKKNSSGNSLVVQWLGLHTFTTFNPWSRN